MGYSSHVYYHIGGYSGNIWSDAWEMGMAMGGCRARANGDGRCWAKCAAMEHQIQERIFSLSIDIFKRSRIHGLQGFCDHNVKLSTVEIYMITDVWHLYQILNL
ncbi:hypothetical protein KC19_2G222700 [Ceratodon purpureus]|uniref:Uncharacterized protein n=1 Tax=Ceratodon purpureus TaxID=3225 RepID=A0A8T0IYX1_CERPU|nr:hypothetical protein KC19_2G222700 [Ceratodon purpureus]